MTVVAGRGLIIVALLALAIWRLIRFMKFGSRLHRMGGPASVPIGVVDPSATASAQPPSSDLRKAPAAVRFAASAAAVVVWLVGNLVLYFVLFQLPFERDLPFIWPLFVAIFANFYLIPFAGRSGRRWAQRFQPESSLIR